MILDGFISAFVGWLINKIRQYAAGIVGRVLATLGIGMTAQNFVLPDLVGWISGYVSGVSADVIALLGYINFDKAITMIVSAYVAKKALRILFAPLSAMNPGGGQTT
jgi:hypothetical protein